MRIGPLFKWFGSKWSGGRYYPSPMFDTIYEPFAGSAGYALNHVNKKVFLYDINYNLWQLWDWLITFAAWNPIAIKDIPLNIPEGTDIRTLGLTTGQELLLKNWQRTNNLSDCWTISAWGNKPGQWTANTRARLMEEVTAIKHWKILPVSNINENTMLMQMKISDITYFVDPPYQYNYQYGVKNFNWLELGNSIMNIPKPSQIIVCEARCPKSQAIPGWLKFTDFRAQVTSRRKSGNNRHSREVIYYDERGC